MNTIAVLRSIAAQAAAEADRLEGVGEPPRPPPVIPPPPPPPVTPPISLGVFTSAFSPEGMRLNGHGRPGVTHAFRFPVTAAPTPAKLTVTETSAGGDLPIYDAWISQSAGGQAIGPVLRWQYTGGAINVGLSGTGPFWLQHKVPAVGDYYFNVQNVSGEAPFYASFSGPFP